MSKEDLASVRAEGVESTIEELLDELAQVNGEFYLADSPNKDQLIGEQAELSVQILQRRKALLARGQAVPVDVVLLLGNPHEEIHPFSRNRLQLRFTDKSGVQRIVGNRIDRLAWICTSRDSSVFFRNFVGPNYIIGQETPINHFITTCLEINAIDTVRERAFKAGSLDRDKSLLTLEEHLIGERFIPAWLEGGYKLTTLELFNIKDCRKMRVKFFSPTYNPFFLPFSRYSPATQDIIKTALTGHA